MLSRHQIKPTDSGWQGVERVYRYLKGTAKMGLNYLSKSGCFEGYFNASFGDRKNPLMTSGYIIKLFGDTIAWRTRKQRYVNLYTCQAEYVSMSDCSQELVSIHNSLANMLTEKFTSMTLWCDNRSAESNVKIGDGIKLRHMTDIKEYYVSECVERLLICVM